MAIGRSTLSGASYKTPFDIYLIEAIVRQALISFTVEVAFLRFDRISDNARTQIFLMLRRQDLQEGSVQR